MAKDPTGFRTKKRKSTKPDESQGLEIGDSGTKILSGFISEEYNSKLQAEAGIRIYDEMRRSDGTVYQAVRACTQPIRAAHWYVEPASDNAKDEEIAAFVEDNLFEHMHITWNDTIRHALLSLPLGVMVFEKVFSVKEIDGVTRIVIDKLAPRLPQSIRRWAINDNEPGIEQIRSDGQTVSIPMDKLVVIVNDREGENWWGNSILRPAYKHWFMKNTIYKIDAIAHERQGLGIPYAKPADGSQPSSKETAKAEKILQNLRANSKAYIIEMNGWEFGFKDMMARSTRDPMPSIDHHNREILKSVLAQFLELGSTNTGSRALSEDHSAMFLKSLESVAQGICDSFNKHLVKELVDLNFEGVTEYPALCFNGITQVDTKLLADTYQVLVGARGIRPGTKDEQYFRTLLELPERDPEDDPTKDVQDTEVDPDNPDQRAQKKKENSELAFAEGATFKPWRALTFAEGKVNFDALNSKMDELEAEFTGKTQELLHAARDKFMVAMTKAAHAGDTQGIKNAVIKVTDELAKIIKNATTAAFVYGKNNAAKEIGAQAPANPAATLKQIDIQANAIADMHISEVESSAKVAYVDALNKGASITAALAAADAAAMEAIDTLTADAASILMGGYINNGRNTVFEDNPDNIYAIQRSELLDNKTCNFCLSIDERVFEKDDPFAKVGPVHSNCRGINVAILIDESEKPKITGIPQSLRDRYGGTVNDVSQPKKAITRANTAARDEADKREQ